MRAVPAESAGDAPALRIARLVELTAPGVWDLDLLTSSFTATPRVAEIFGFPADEPLEFQSLVTVTHPEDRSWAAFLHASVEPHGAPMTAKFRIKRKDNAEIRWIQARIWRNPARRGDSRTIGYTGTVDDVTEEMETARALIESEERLRLAIEAGKMAVWEVDLETGAMTQSPELNLLCGFAPEATVSLQDVRALYNAGEIERLAREQNTVEAVRDRAVGGAFEPRRPGALQVAGHRTQVQAEVAITTPAGVPKHLMLRAQYAPLPDGRPRLAGLLVDITDSKRAEERIAVVARELQHRVKNLLSVTGAIAQQSLRGKSDVKAALQVFLGRLNALAAANDLILARSSAAADVQELVRQITLPYSPPPASPIVFEGPGINLRPAAATALGMILHELCTNAVKYGALAVEKGEVEIRWSRQDGDTMVMTWHERNGPPVCEPKSKGFGSRLLESLLAGELGGSTLVEFAPSGLRCKIEMRLDGP